MRPLPRSLGRWLPALLLALVAILIGPAADAGHDDFEFGRKLAESRMFDYARMVFEGVLASTDAKEEDKDEARYGLAILKREEAVAACARADVTQDDVATLFEEAASGIEEFVRKNPKNKHASTARLDIGTIRLAYVQWARELLEDPEEVAQRNIDVDKLRDSAADNIDKAIEYFGQLRPKMDEDSSPLQEMADYYFVVSQYYSALVEPPCSEASVMKLNKASELLDDYIMMHEGQLLGIYAMDIYGLVWWELAKCEESNEEQRASHYDKAYEWFEACIYTPNDSPDHERVITSGYYHIGQLGLDGAQRGNRAIERQALSALEGMLEALPTAWRSDNGLRALIEWSKLECHRENAAKAVEIAQLAGDKAKAASKGYLERLANRHLNQYVAGGCGGSLGGMAPDVLMRVAEDLAQQGKWADAIRAYRKVIESAPDTTEGFLTFKWKSWEQISRAYRQLGDWLGMAIALQPIHEAWMSGTIPFEKGNREDANMTRAAQARDRAQGALKMYVDETGSALARTEQKRIRDNFPKDYPETDISKRGVWNSALDRFNTADKGKKAGKPTWRNDLTEAKKLMRQVGTNKEQAKQHQAWVFLVRSEILADNLPAAVKVAEEAMAYFQKPEQKAHAAKYDRVRVAESKASAELEYWKSEALMRQDKAEEAGKVLDGFLTRYPGIPKQGYPSSHALSNLVKARLASEDIEKADVAYRHLLERDPKFKYLANITFDFANHYAAKRKIIEDELNKTLGRIKEVKPALRKAERQWHSLSQDLSDTRALVDKYKAAIALFEKNKKILAGGGRPTQTVNQDVMKAARAEEETKALATRAEDIEKRLKTTKLEWDKLEPEMAGLLKQRHDLRLAQYPPTRKSADYYKVWDDALKGLEEAEGKSYRKAQHLDAFGQLWWTLGRLRPELTENWLNAQGYYEDFLARPSIQKLSNSDKEKRKALSRLGDVYIRLAEAEPAETKRRQLVTRAVDLLQSAIARRPQDNDLVVSMLANKVLVLTWKDPDQKTWRFPLPVPGDVPELRKSAQKIGKSDDPYLPKFANEGEKRRYQDALKKFRNKLIMLDDKKLKTYLPKEGASSFDARLYRQLAQSSSDFRLALAWAYSKTGRDEDVPKAVNLLLTFLKRGPLAAPEDSEEFWQANDIFATLYLDTAQRWLGQGAPSADTATLLEQVGERIKRIHANYSTFGEDTVEGNHDHWKDLLTRLNVLRREARLPTIQLQRVAVDKPEGPAKPEKPEAPVQEGN